MCSANFDGCVTKLRKNQLQKTLQKPFLLIFHEFFRDIFQTDLIQTLK